jgi:hypothetical protein
MVSETELGRVGMLICGENTNPLPRYALMAQGEQFHISTYPLVRPTRPPNDGGNYYLERHPTRARGELRRRARSTPSRDCAARFRLARAPAGATTAPISRIPGTPSVDFWALPQCL